jgi:flavin reductase (DIM6/NTAB) family NADH-FMN oxidoreductase RutF
MIINPSTLTSEKEMYKLLIGAVVPRPIAWVSTISKQGTPNLAPYSFYTVASRNPPMLCFSVGEGIEGREGTEKDTLVNIRQMKEFVINVVSTDYANEMHQTAKNVGPEIDEFQLAGLTAAESVSVSAPRIKEAPISMECVLEQILKLGTDHLIIGRVVQYHIQDHLYKDGKVDLKQLKPLGRLAGNYTKIESIFDLPLE